MCIYISYFYSIPNALLQSLQIRNMETNLNQQNLMPELSDLVLKTNSKLDLASWKPNLIEDKNWKLISGNES